MLYSPDEANGIKNAKYIKLEWTYNECVFISVWWKCHTFIPILRGIFSGFPNILF